MLYKNKVIIIGADHYNTLGLCRSFGVNGIKPIGFIVNSSTKKGYCSLSRYWGGKHVLNDYSTIIDILISEYGGESLPPVLFPSNDIAAYLIDDNREKLQDIFIIPGFISGNYSITKLINKEIQARWANELGIETAKTWLLDFSESIEKQLDGLTYPCIAKPVGGNEGTKGDIRKCENSEVFLQVIKELQFKKNYKRVLIQEFIEKDYEMELFGCIPHNAVSIPFILTRHLREWPPVGGSVSCHQYIKDETLVKKAEDILSKIRLSGFVGLFDIELFKVGEKVLLNEVNYRNSGDIYASFSDGFNYPYYWYLDAIGEDVTRIKLEYTDNHYAMNEVNDFNHVRARFISFKEWWHFRRKTKDFAFWFKKDPLPSLYHCLPFYLACISNPRIKETRI